MLVHAMAGPRTPPPSRRGFTLAELLVVIGIIALLVSILVPMIGKVRILGQTADTSALIRAIDAACQTYYQDHRAWPGPLAANELGIDAATKTPSVVLPAVKAGTDGFYRVALMDDPTLQGVTGAENLVLGLLGGLVPDIANPGQILYDPAAVGRGPVKLGGRTPGAHSLYLDIGDRDLSMHAIADEDVAFANGSGSEGLRWGRFVDGAAAAADSIIPEFVDRFGSPLPILYMRARATGRITDANAATDIVGDDPSANPVFLHTEIDSYVAPNASGASIGAKTAPEPYHVSGTPVPGTIPPYHGLQLDVYPGGVTAPNPATVQDLRDMMSKGTNNWYTYPYDARAYLLSPSAVGARQGDRYVLISAGPDRVYGTDDDVTNFGAVR